MTDIRQEIETHIPNLRRYARALVHDVTKADDLVQDCLTRALTKLHLWRDGSNLRAWLFTILHNQYVNHIRRSIREGVTIELSDLKLQLSRAADQDKRLELRDLDRALARLPTEQRTVILLVGLEGMSYEDVAAAVGVPVGTVRSRLSRGRLALRGLMGIEPEQGAETVTPNVRRRSPSAGAAPRLALSA